MKEDKELFADILEDSANDFKRELDQATERINVTIPNMLFQEKYTTGFLWWKKSYYKYFRYSNGSLIGVSVYSTDTIDDLESDK